VDLKANVGLKVIFDVFPESGMTPHACRGKEGIEVLPFPTSLHEIENYLNYG
jgi:hypothetical protein